MFGNGKVYLRHAIYAHNENIFQSNYAKDLLGVFVGFTSLHCRRRTDAYIYIEVNNEKFGFVCAKFEYKLVIC